MSAAARGRPAASSAVGPDRARARRPGSSAARSSSALMTACPSVRRQRVEQAPLGREVAVHVAVEVEVVAGQVREHRHAGSAQPCTRLSASECEETSITAWSQPASTISRNSACRSEDSGVVRTASARRSPMRYCMVPEQADLVAGRAQGGVDQVAWSWSCRWCRSRPTSVRRCGGIAQHGRRAAWPAPRARRGTWSQGAAGLRRLLGGDRDRALPARGVHELVAVRRQAADGHEERARARPCASRASPPRRTTARRREPGARQPRGQLAQRHGGSLAAMAALPAGPA